MEALEREPIFAGGDEPTEQLSNRGKSIFQLRPETSPGNFASRVEEIKSSYP